jgi:hypothetical protein
MVFSLPIHLLPVPASSAPQTDVLAEPVKWAQSLFVCRANLADVMPNTAYCAEFSALPIVIFRSFIAQALENQLHLLGHTRCSL